MKFLKNAYGGCLEEDDDNDDTTVMMITMTQQ